MDNASFSIPATPPQGELMKRDMDLVRKIILATAELGYAESLSGLPDVPEEDFIVHVHWLIEAGLVSGAFQAGQGSMAKYAMVDRLTWAGCEFADSVKSDTLWTKAKGSVLKPGISWSFEVLKDWLKAEITQGLPTLGNLT